MGYSWRGRAAALSGMGAVAIAMVMALSPAAVGASAGIVIHATYHGAVSPSNYVSTSGCGKVAVAKAWNFHMKTGLGGASNTGKAQACKKVVNGVGQSGDASASGSFEVAIPMKIPSSASSVAVNSAVKLAATLKATDGITTGNPTCNAPTYSYYDYGNFYEWGFSGFSFAYYNESYGYSSSSGYSYNYSYANAATPSPFNLNNTSYEDVYVSYGASSSCYAESELFMYAYSSLSDTTTGAGVSCSADTLGTAYTYSQCTSEMIDTFIEVYNQTSWSCYGSTYWDGPYNYSYSSPFACTSYNTTLTSVVYNYYPTFSSSTGTNNTQTWTGSMSTAGTMYFNGTFTGTDHYVLFFTVYADAFAYNTWKHGSGSWSFNMATLGNGWNLKSIVIT